MPQINRIRVNNVKYNFGTQFYDDFLMRFSCKNTIYDLANGGGKSVLMLLLLQTVIPNCTLDEKQPVEKLFRTDGGSTTIHSLVEWKLDSCDVKEGFKYMTCGFCARKAKDGEGEEKTSGGSIEYFNYCIFYREFGENDIKNLPLVNGQERITYNGLKNYLKDLEKRDFSVKVKIFERKGEYQNYINEYGIFESHWELIRGINKTEGHVRTYFENSYKTTRKVVEDLLIEEIIEKSYNSRIRSQDGDDDMAKTLLDIKDKLLELSKRRGEMDAYDRQIELIKNFSKKTESFAGLFAGKEREKAALVTFLSRAKAQVLAAEERRGGYERKIAQIRGGISEEEKLIAAAGIVEEEKELAGITELAGEIEEKLKKLSAQYEECKDRIVTAQTAEDYDDYVKYEKTLAKLREYMDSRHRDRSDITQEMKNLARMKYAYMQKDIAEKNSEKEELATRNKECLEACTKHTEECKKQEYECAKAEGVLKELEKRLAVLECGIKETMRETSLLVAENAGKEAERLKAEYDAFLAKKKNIDYEQDELRKKQSYNVKETAATEARIASAVLDEERIEKEMTSAYEYQEDVTSLGKVYDEKNPKQLRSVVWRVYDRMLSGRETLNRKRQRTLDFISAIEGKMPTDTQGVKVLYEYLDGRYAGKVVTGAGYLKEHGEEECLLLTERFPYLPYSVVVKEDYDIIITDTNIMTVDCDGVVPIIDISFLEQEDEQESAAARENGGKVVFACRGLSFIYDEAGRRAGMKIVQEELEHIDAELSRVNDRIAVVADDYGKLCAYERGGQPLPDELERQLDTIRKNLAALRDKKDKLCAMQENFAARETELCERGEELTKKASETDSEIDRLLDIARLNDELNECLAKIGENKNRRDVAKRTAKTEAEIAAAKDRAKKDIAIKINRIDEGILEIGRRWEDFAPYYDGDDREGNDNGANSKSGDENGNAAAYDKINGGTVAYGEKNEYGVSAMPQDKLDARFDALKQLIAEEMGDLTDKERLMENCRAGMDRIARAMQYRGIPLEKAAKMNEEGVLNQVSAEEFAGLTETQEAISRKISEAENEFESVNARKNRMEGSLTHARRSLEEKYGALGELNLPGISELANPSEYIRQHGNELARKKELCADAERKARQNEKQCTEYLLIKKDLERIVKSMGIDPDTVAAGNILTDTSDGRASDDMLTDTSGNVAAGAPASMPTAASGNVSAAISENTPPLTVKEYEEAGKRFDSILKDEQRKKEAFIKDRNELADALATLGAYELSQEIKRNVEAPSDAAAAIKLAETLKDTADCIALERDRTGRGIEDMERIKDNFENRCVQICSNIRTQLERLPKMSRISLDDEVIPVLSLNIPYIKEEMYKDRMSVYIDETAEIAENFKTYEEKLKYIKGRLTWKRLFSVIVTDMNSIKLNLYKRERIKDQSRYLRYEEAVGSTGQSQGIYIQFLVAVINYIASINGAGKESAVLGKTIFIDNPFGAAKDIYIWEPIFKLLKTNHVQLIVPARGVTPAITGRFDVNYVLGQKMTDGRQQTVVVEYNSRTDDDELEYERLSFLQESFDFPE